MREQADQIVISVEGISKTFKLPHEKTNSIKSAIIHSWRKRRTYEIQKALENVTFNVKKGEFFGIVGRNGSGKSTLLKLLAGIYIPTKGRIQVNGSLTPFIELGVGFNPELTGRENVFLNGALLGFNRKQMNAMYKDIVEFAELERFMDQKLKNYSSGMLVRLAFSIAIRSHSDILLIDEVLAVGDAAFQKKCFDYFRKIKLEDKTIIFVTHDMNNVREFCDKAILIESSEIKFIGDPNEAASKYLLITEGQKDVRDHNDRLNSEQGIELIDVKLIGKKAIYSNDDTIKFSLRYKLSKPLKYQLGMSIIKDGASLHEKDTTAVKLPQEPGSYTIEWEASTSSLNQGMHYINVAALTDKDFSLLAYINNANSFMVQTDVPDAGGLMNMHSKWQLVKN